MLSRLLKEDKKKQGQSRQRSGRSTIYIYRYIDT